MPTYSITGKRQQTVTHVFSINDTDDNTAERLAIAEFKRRYPGVTGIKAVRKKEITVIPNPVIPSVAMSDTSKHKRRGQK